MSPNSDPSGQGDTRGGIHLKIVLISLLQLAPTRGEFARRRNRLCLLKPVEEPLNISLSECRIKDHNFVDDAIKTPTARPYRKSDA